MGTGKGEQEHIKLSAGGATLSGTRESAVGENHALKTFSKYENAIQRCKPSRLGKMK
jgi:hypothetical protein